MGIASISSALYPLAGVGCAAMCGGMMLMMMRGTRRERREADPRVHQARASSLEQLREEQLRLGEEIERREQQEQLQPRENR